MGYIHSIDMLYIEYFSYLSPDKLLEVVRAVHERYPDVNYDEYLDKPYSSKWQFYNTNVCFGGVYLQMGKYTNYDKVTKTFDILNMFQIRLNPNKLMHLDYIKDLLSSLMIHVSSGVIKKFDYAIDIPLPMKSVHIFDSRKERGLYKGTRYLGQSGRHGYCKIYDKQKESNLDSVLTRVEFTQMANMKRNIDNVFVMTSDALKTDFNELDSVNRTIVEMYLQIKSLGGEYEFDINPRRMAKIKEYISGQYVSLDYGTILDELLSRVRHEFDANVIEDIVTDDEGFVQVPDSEMIWE